MGDNPDNSFTIAPFEKGFQFLQFIEDFVIGYYHMEDFITYYLTMNNLSSINAFEGFRKTFSNFIETYWGNANRVNQILSSIWYEEWIYPVGPDPTGLLFFNNTATNDAKQLALAYIALGGASSPAGFAAYHTWYSNQQVVFHQTLLQNKDTDLAIVTLIDSDLNITSQTDPEVRQRWYAIGLYLNYAPVYTPAETWVSEMGRNKYLNSIYEALTESGQVALGIQWYNENINFYSPTSKTMIQQILGITQQ
jgi:hypothetical protein